MGFNSWFQDLKIHHQSWINKYRSLSQLQTLGSLLGLLNINAFIAFALCFLFQDKIFTYTYVFISVVLLWVVGYVFLNAASWYEGSKWFVWGWVSMAFISPMGMFLMFYTFQNKYWEIDNKQLKDGVNVQTFGKFLKPELEKLKRKWKESLDYLEKLDSSMINDIIFKAFQLKDKNFNNWNIFQITFILALALTTRQLKQKDSSNIEWGAHWYDEQYFHFAIKNNKIINHKNKYIYSIGVIVLDEINNYQKLVDMRQQIKNNLKFGPAKVICLKWGNEYQTFVNE